MIEFPEKINFGEILNLYGNKKSDVSKPPDIEKLNFDKKTVQNKMNELTHKLLGAYTAIDQSSQGTTIDKEDVWKKRIPFLAEIVDDTIPLTLFAMKTFSHDKTIDRKSETISFDLVKGRVEGNTPNDIYQAWKSLLQNGCLSHLEFTDQGDLFDLKDRKTDEKFRGQGFASMLLQTSENFIQTSADKKQKTATAFVDAAQLDVICWLYNSGYRPQTDQDTQRLNEVLAGGSNIMIGENNYIFKNAPEESQVIKLPDGRTVPNRHNAYRIKFVKEFAPKISTDVTDVQKKTHDSIKTI